MRISAELFGGCGGLTLGLKQAGFRNRLWVERDETCVQTAAVNSRALDLPPPVVATDAAAIDWALAPGSVDLLAGGVPCQPFSFGGQSLGRADERDAFPQMIRALRSLQPRAVLVENVKGFASETFDAYFGYVLLQIEMPELVRRSGESWRSHRIRLERAKPAYSRSGALAYAVNWKVLQAADFGLAQMRERLFIVGYRKDLGLAWRPPRVTHSRGRLLHDMFVSQRYWQSVGLRPRQPSGDQRSAVVQLSSETLHGRAWRTVRQALGDLPAPLTNDHGKMRHFLHSGATPYEGHVGSRLDWPAKTIKAGVHGVPGGENMVHLANGRVRYFTLREAARLQGFPDSYEFEGSWTQAYRQIGNAVPVRLAAAVARSVAEQLDGVRLSVARTDRTLVAS